METKRSIVRRIPTWAWFLVGTLVAFVFAFLFLFSLALFHQRDPPDQIIVEPAPPPPPPDGPETHAMIPVFYATDRAQVMQIPIAFGPRRNEAESLILGRFDVSIPRNAHETGRIERPSIWTFWRESTDAHFVIADRVRHTYEGFYSDVARIVTNSAAKQAFVFVHGYNVAFEDAIYRTAQVAYDLDFDGAPILYSWPSEATLIGYPVDANNAEWTAPHLRWFLEDVARRSGAQVIHLIAHSMGNRPLVAALGAMARESSVEVKSRFRQIVLAAPDIDASTFRQLALAMRCRFSEGSDPGFSKPFRPCSLA